MAAIAQLKAILGLDTSQYRTGMTEAEQVNHKFAQSLQSTERRIHNVSQVGRGLGQVLSGNIAGGVNSIVNGLDLVTSKAAMAVAQIGAVFAAFGAGWAGGSALYKAFDLDKNIPKWMGGPKKGNEAEWEENAQLREAGRSRRSVTGIDAETEKIRESLLEGREKAEKEHANAVREIRAKSNAALSADEKAAYQRQIEALDAVLAKELKAIEDAEKKKADAEKKRIEERQARYDKSVAKETERTNERISDIRDREYMVQGRDIRRDQMAAVGGMIGQSREDVGLADKQLQIMKEDAERQKEIVKVQREHLERLAELKDAMSGGAI